MLVQAHTMMNSYIKKPRHRSVSGLPGTFIPCCLVILLTLIVKVDGQGLMQKGIQIPVQTKRDLTEALQPLETAVEFIQQSEDPFLQAYAPDVLIYLKAVKGALEHNEFHRENQFDVAERLIVHGLERAAHLMNGKAPWAHQTGLVVRGYQSRLDDSVQPYGLVVPSSWQAGTGASHRMDVWLHGRDNSLTELKFIDQRERSPVSLLLNTHLCFIRTGDSATPLNLPEKWMCLRQWRMLKSNIPSMKIEFRSGGFRWGEPDAGIWRCTMLINGPLRRPARDFPSRRIIWVYGKKRSNLPGMKPNSGDFMMRMNMP